MRYGFLFGLSWRSSTAEQLICNQQVVGSNPIASSRMGCSENIQLNVFKVSLSGSDGEVPEWPKGADCKSAAVRLRRFESCPLHHHAGIAQLVEREPSKLGVAGSSPVSRSNCVLGPTDAQVAQSVEHVLGKDEVSGSIPLLGF